jgi:two-component system response regulator NreC
MNEPSGRESLAARAGAEVVDGDGAKATIVIADDHRVVRRGLRLVLEEAGFEIASEAGDVAAALRKVRAYKPNVLVLDLNMPGGSSLQAIPRFREVSPGTAIVVLTVEAQPAYAREALRSGASAYVLKEAAARELEQAVRGALSGHRYLSPRLGARVATEPEIASGLPDELSDREGEVLHLLALGHTNSQIANVLFLSVRTIEAHRSRIQHKTGRISRAELVSYAREHGLFDHA